MVLGSLEVLFECLSIYILEQLIWKQQDFFSFLILISLVSNANAQLRVLSNGRVQAGLLKDNNEDLGNVTSMQIYGRIGMHAQVRN